MSPLALIAAAAGLFFALSKRSPSGSGREDEDALTDLPPRFPAELVPLVGAPYSYGGGRAASAWPDGSPGDGGGVGFDCSSLAWWAVAALSTEGATEDALGPLETVHVGQLAERLSAANDGAQLFPGDIAVYGESWDDPSHVAVIATSDGAVITASGGGPSTNGDSPDARVKVFDSAAYRGDLLGYLVLP